MEKPLRVLVLEDSEKDTLLLIRRLRRGGYCPVWERVDNLESLKQALCKASWDIVISDHSMPHFSAVTALQLLKERGIDLPVIIVSGTIAPEAAVAAMKAGASDFIMKDDLTRLIPAIERELREALERQARRKAEEQFLQAQKMESIGRLAGGVAHDFNNLLTAIMGYSELLLAGMAPADPKYADILEIKAASERAALLTRQLLAFSRKQILQFRVLDLGSVVAGVENLLRRLIGEDIEMFIAGQASLGSVKADAGQLEQIIMNLCVNARDAMPAGGILTIKTADAELDGSESNAQFDITPGPYVRLSVADTGCGIEPAVLAKIFEPFFTTKPPDKGTGLGLSTVYGIVKQCGGYILIETSPGRGTVFSIYLPRVKETAEAESGGVPAASLRGSETILLVEDDDRVRNLSARILGQLGYAVLQAKSGEDALAFCAQDRGVIDLMVTDVVMPQMSGGELARQIAGLLPDLRVLFLSGYTESIIADKGILKPGIEFLQKPFAPEVLARKIREILDSSRG